MILNDILNNEYQLVLDKILSYLDVASVAVLGSCSKQNRRIVNSSLIWLKFCHKKGYEKYYYLVDLPNHSCVPSSTRATASPIYVIPDCVSLDKLGFWREVYNRAEHLIKNWRSGVYVIAPILKGHKGKISAFDSDDSKIVSGSREAKEIKVWSIDDCECINTIKLRTDSINCLKIYKDEIIVAGEDGIIRIYDQIEGDLKFTLTNNQTFGAVLNILIQNDIVLAIFSDKSIKAWSLLSYDLKFILRGHTDDIECIHSFENYLITGSWDKTIILWDLINGCKLTKLEGHTEVINCLKMKTDTIISGSSDNSVRIWNLKFKTEQTDSFKPQKSLELIEPIILEGHSSDVYCLEIYGDYISSGGSDSLVIIWNFTGDLLFKLSGHLGNVRSLFMNDYYMVSGGDAKRIMIWDYKNGTLLNIIYRNPNKLDTMIVNDTKIVTVSPETGSNITIVCYW